MNTWTLGRQPSIYNSNKWVVRSVRCQKLLYPCFFFHRPQNPLSPQWGCIIDQPHKLPSQDKMTIVRSNFSILLYFMFMTVTSMNVWCCNFWENYYKHSTKNQLLNSRLNNEICFHDYSMLNSATVTSDLQRCITRCDKLTYN